MLELQTLKDIAECYRMLEENDKLARVCAQIAGFEDQPDVGDDRKKHFEELLRVAKKLGKLR